jgi:hypothetical protein
VSGDHQHLHVVDRSLLTTLAFTYGVSDNLEVGLTTGYYGASDVGEAHGHDGGGYAFDDYGRIDGIADSWFIAKMRVYTSSGGDVALLAGLKAYNGADDITFDDIPIDQSLQPGSGAMDVAAGMAYTRDIGDRFMMDASLQYVYSAEGRDYRVGDQLNVGLAVAARMRGDVHSARWFAGFLELDARRQGQNEEGGEPHVNSGGSWLFVSPGVRGDVLPWLNAVVSVQLPVIQDPNDTQQELDYKLTTSFSTNF